MSLTAPIVLEFELSTVKGYIEEKIKSYCVPPFLLGVLILLPNFQKGGGEGGLTGR